MRRRYIPAFHRNYRELAAFAEAISSYLGWDYAITSFYRNDRTAHSRGRALDIAFRSGPLYTMRRTGNTIYYRWLPVWALLRKALKAVSSQHPNITRVIVEADHLHIEHSDTGRTTVRPVLYRYSPPVHHALTSTGGVVPRLRSEFDHQE